MEFNNGNERRKLNKKWERLRVQYQQAGMSEDAIQAMYDFDLGVLNSERSYVANTLAIVDDGDDNTGRKSSDFKQYEKAITVTDTYHETRTRFAWVGEIKDKRLQEGLEKLSDEELRLITLYFRDEWRKMADGSLDDTLRIRYTCYGKLRKQTNCTGQTGYTVHILDEIIDKAVRQIFSKMRGIPKEQIVTKRYEKENAERKNHLQDLQTQRNKAEKDLLALKTEVLACIKGESVLPRETLAEMITAQEEKLTELENLCEAASEELEKTAELMDKVSRLYDELISYADLYDSANFEAKKMIVNQLIRRVDVYRGYQINISFNFDLTPYIEGE